MGWRYLSHPNAVCVGSGDSVAFDAALLGSERIESDADRLDSLLVLNEKGLDAHPLAVEAGLVLPFGPTCSSGTRPDGCAPYSNGRIPASCPIRCFASSPCPAFSCSPVALHQPRMLRFSSSPRPLKLSPTFA
ncbi:hypothetical protein EMIT0P44_750002 [Pseudomonas sp. IT-P44]